MTNNARNLVSNATNSDATVIPEGLTSHLQPADLCWNKPFKAAYKKLYGEWTATGQKTYTHAGNIHAPGKLQCLEWVKKAWESVQVEVVIKSFRSCGIAVQVNGSEDKEIHRIQDGGIAAEAFEDISRSTATLLASHERESDGDDDPFKDIDEDEEELEVVIDNNGESKDDDD